MKLLTNEQIQTVSGGGMIAAVTTLPISFFMGLGATGLAIATSPIIAINNGKDFTDGISKAIDHIALGPQVSVAFTQTMYEI